MDRKLTAIYSLAFTSIIGLALAAVTAWNLLAGWAAITVAVTAALVIRPD